MISAFVAAHGYVAVFVGTLIEGETILLAAGFAAHRGLLHWPVVLAVAFAGATLGDQLAFLLGRWKGAALLARFPALAQHVPRIHALLEHHRVAFILSVRFLYGLRIAGPIVLGTSSVPRLHFAALNTIGAAIWTLVITGIGYYFGVVMEALLADIKHVEEAILVGILAAGCIWWMWRRKHVSR